MPSDPAAPVLTQPLVDPKSDSAYQRYWLRVALACCLFLCVWTMSALGYFMHMFGTPCLDELHRIHHELQLLHQPPPRSL